MSLPHAWARLPGPADFLDTILDDLTDRTAVVAGLPNVIPTSALAVEVAEMVRQRHLGRWEPIRSSEANMHAPEDSIARRSTRSGGDPVLWIDATGDDLATDSWVSHVRRLADEPKMPRLCIVANSACAQACSEDKRLRRRIWGDFVTGLDARALVQRHSRRQGQSSAHRELKSAVVAELAGEDLACAERLAREPLGRLLDDSEHRCESVWAAQVATLFPLIERERQRLLETYRALWHLPHVRPDGFQVSSPDQLEIGDLARQLASIPSLREERKRAEWLRGVRNALAHSRKVSWSTLISPAAVEIVDFRE